jgi:hypothetical protein
MSINTQSQGKKKTLQNNIKNNVNDYILLLLFLNLYAMYWWYKNLRSNVGWYNSRAVAVDNDNDDNDNNNYSNIMMMKSQILFI